MKMKTALLFAFGVTLVFAMVEPEERKLVEINNNYSRSRLMCKMLMLSFSISDQIAIHLFTGPKLHFYM
jgi:hypothetical protein